MKNILITGGAGFIGSNLCTYLLKKKFNIYALDNLSVGKKSNLTSNKIKFIKKDILDINKIKFKKKINIVIHLAARAEILIPKEKENLYYNSNILGLQSVLNFASNHKVEKFIFASSASVYGDTKNHKVKESFLLCPQHYYAYTKYIGEKMTESYCNINNLKYVIFRFFNVYGIKSNAVVSKFIAQKVQRKKITIYGDGKQKRDFIHIDDLNKAIYKSIKIKKVKNEIFNMGSGNAISILKLKNIISSDNNHIHLKKRNDDIEISISDIRKIRKKLKWKPFVNFKKGVKEMEKSDKSRLINIKIPSVKNQIKLIKKFNSSSK